MCANCKSIRVLGFFAAALVLSSLRAEALPCDKLGSNWKGCEYTSCQWSFEFRRPTCGSTLWNAYWSHPSLGRVQGNITITMSGTTVNISRPAIGGAPSCNYVGTWYPRDVHNALPYRVIGTYTCGSYKGPWKASIY